MSFSIEMYRYLPHGAVLRTQSDSVIHISMATDWKRELFYRVLHKNHALMFGSTGVSAALFHLTDHFSCVWCHRHRQELSAFLRVKETHAGACPLGTHNSAKLTRQHVSSGSRRVR